MSPLLISIIAGAGATAVCSFIAFNAGVAHDKQRSDLVAANKAIEAKNNLAAANKANADLTAKLQQQQDAAAAAMEVERETNRLRERAADAVGERLRLGVTAFARGPGTSADSIATCRAEAGRLGDVLAHTLRAHRECTSSAETEAGTARRVLRGWPQE